VFKTTVSGKVAQKKCRDCVDSAREEVFLQRADSAETFVQKWIKLSIEKLSKTGGNVHLTLKESDAIRLFNGLIQEGGGLPMYLVRLHGGKPPEDWVEVKTAVSQAYSLHPAPRQTSCGGGKGKGAGSWSAPSWNTGFDVGFGKGKGACGKGDSWDSWGGGGWDSWGGCDGEMMTAMWNAMGEMMASQGGWGGKGYSPY